MRQFNAPDALENPITHVVVDTHRWRSVVTVIYMSGDEKQVVVGVLPDDGLGEFDSYDEYERACH